MTSIMERMGGFQCGCWLRGLDRTSTLSRYKYAPATITADSGGQAGDLLPVYSRPSARAKVTA